MSWEWTFLFYIFFWIQMKLCWRHWNRETTIDSFFYERKKDIFATSFLSSLTTAPHTGQNDIDTFSIVSTACEHKSRHLLRLWAGVEHPSEQWGTNVKLNSRQNPETTLSPVSQILRICSGLLYCNGMMTFFGMKNHKYLISSYDKTF